jgi:hypothetical protein
LKKFLVNKYADQDDENIDDDEETLQEPIRFITEDL